MLLDEKPIINDRKKFILRYLLTLAGIVVLFGLVIYFIYQQRANSISESLETTEISNVALIENSIVSEMYFVVSDLQVISRIPAIKHYLNDPSLENYNNLASFFLTFSKYREIYDQVRFVGVDGKEIVRVNNIHGSHELVSAEQLQDKSDRSYHQDIVDLKQGEIFISALDLNNEFGKVVEPYKPVLRFAIGVFDEQGVKRGSFLLNYLGQMMLDRLQMNGLTPGEIMLVDQDGYYLLNQLDPLSTWGNVLEFRKQNNIANDFPEQWQHIKEKGLGQLLDEKGLFTYTMLSPVEPEAAINYGKNFPVVTHQPTWYLITYLSPETIGDFQFPARNSLATVYAILVVASTAIAAVMAKASLDIERQQRELRFNAMHDRLTTLPNRNLFDDRIQQAQLRLAREKIPYTVFMMDLNGFKHINDTFGHDAGDATLREVAARVSNQLRTSDTLARFGGDEFCVIAHGVGDQGAALVLAERLMTAIAEPIWFNTAELKVSGAIGISIQTVPGKEVDDILREADAAMYSAKRDPHGQPVIAPPLT